MSVLIKGMEMPTSCPVCPMLEGDRMDGLCHAANKWLDDDEYWTWYVYPEGDMDDSKPCNCPLVPVPTPHGRLIDADALKLSHCKECTLYPDKCLEKTGEGCDWGSIYHIEHCAPTIIEAEEGE